MIKWKKYDPNKPPEDCTDFLVTNGKNILIASLQFDSFNGLAWWDMDSELLSGVTHYAEINLPG